MGIQQIRGDKGEETAASYLQKINYDILERNYRSKKSEVDIICKLGETLVFVEVKLRTSDKYGKPESFVSEAKASKIMEGAEAYINENDWNGNIRFDIISILIRSGTEEIKHFKDAFY